MPNRASWDKNGPHRVFILGAGASAFAGFPIGRGLWEFLVDHCGIDLGAMEWIDAHLSTLPKTERERVTGNFEWLLTQYEMNLLPRVAMLRERSAAPPPNDPGEKAYFIAQHKHLVANPDEADFEDMYRVRLMRRASNIVGWMPGADSVSMQELADSIRQAFFNHHACIRHGGANDAADPEAHHNRCSFDVCPCYREFGWPRIQAVRKAVARTFKASDTIVTFNWDALIESILWHSGKWSFSDGYGIPVDVDADNLHLLGVPRVRLQKPSPIKILKAHGSINWLKSAQDEKVGIIGMGVLFDMQADVSFSPDGDEDIPEWPYVESAMLNPTYLKDYSAHDTLGDVWVQIVEAVEKATEITVIGFSLPRGDASARAMLAYALRQNKRCKLVHIVTLEDPHESNWRPFLEAARKEGRWDHGTFENWVQNPIRLRSD